MIPRTDSDTLAKALDILARDIQSNDGVANAAIAEGADRIRELSARVVALEIALQDALSTYRNDGKTVLVSAERQEAWAEALKPHSG